MTRRDVLRAAAWAGAAAAAGAAGAASQIPQGHPATQPATTSAASLPSVPAPWWMIRHSPRSRVVDVRSANVVRSTFADRVVLQEMLTYAVMGFTTSGTPRDAWRLILGDVERVAIKFNSVGAEVINTSDAMAHALVGSLTEAGWAPSQLQLVEIPPYLREDTGTRPIEKGDRGWGPAISVGGRQEQLANWFCQADAVINVPFLKTHRIAGMSCAMKNLAYAVIRRPELYHANACSPFVGEIIGAPEVAGRLKLNVVNALRIVLENGPEAREEDISAYGGLFVGVDPVATDAVCLELLSAQRFESGLSGDLEVAYLESAARMGVGRHLPPRIDRFPLETGT